MVTKSHSTSRLSHAVARFREARKTLHTPASRWSRAGLDWMNFFVADVQTGFGAFVAFYLAHHDWSVRDVGFVLTIGSLAGVVSQIPGGALADALPWKRGLIAVGIGMIGTAALIFAFAPTYFPVLMASLVQGASGGVITPAIGAVALASSAAAQCRCGPAETTALLPAATPQPPQSWDWSAPISSSA
jgi:predicted MFS family arabinose efflux permease